MALGTALILITPGAAQDIAVPPPCTAPIKPLIRTASLAPAPSLADWKGEKFQDMSGVWSFSALGQDCMDSVNAQPDGPTPLCRKAADFREAHMQALQRGDWPQGRYHELARAQAPLKTFRRSEHESDTYVYDSRDQSLRLIFTTGC